MQRVIPNNINELSNLWKEILKTNVNEEAYQLLYKSLFPDFDLSEQTIKLLTTHKLAFEDVKAFFHIALGEIGFPNIDKVRKMVLLFFPPRSGSYALPEAELATDTLIMKIRDHMLNQRRQDFPSSIHKFYLRDLYKGALEKMVEEYPFISQGLSEENYLLTYTKKSSSSLKSNPVTGYCTTVFTVGDQPSVINEQIAKKGEIKPEISAKILNFLLENKSTLLMLAVISYGIYDHYHENNIGKTASAIKNNLFSLWNKPTNPSKDQTKEQDIEMIVTPNSFV